MATGTNQNPGGCNCGVPYTFELVGCSNLAFVSGAGSGMNATLTIYASLGGALLATISGVTDSTVQTVNLPSGTTPYVVLSGTAATGFTLATYFSTHAGTAYTLQLTTVASGYVCSSCCASPLPTTLLFTLGGGGSASLTYNSGTGCYSGLVGGYQVYFSVSTCTLSGAGCGIGGAGPTAKSCPPALSLTFAYPGGGGGTVITP